MNFQQLRAVREAIRRGFNLTEVAAVLHTSQPGISRQIRELEDELGLEIFVRSGKRLTGLTPPGEAVLPIIRRLLLDAANLRRVGEDFNAQHRGRCRSRPPTRRRAMRCRRWSATSGRCIRR